VLDRIGECLARGELQIPRRLGIEAQLSGQLAHDGAGLGHGLGLRR
jgi:hypothetical protein